MKSKIKITILSCIWQRPEITILFLKGLERIRRNAPDWVELSFVLVYSNQLDYLTLQHLKYDQFYHLVYAPNRPLGRKHNLGISFLANCLEFDYCMQLGSDDLLSDETWQHYYDWFAEERKFFGLNSLYFYDTLTHQIAHYQSTQVFGAGRCIHNSIINQFVRTTGYTDVWGSMAEQGLDRNSEQRIQYEVGFKNIRVMPVVTEKPMVIDLKSNTNINPFSSLPDMRTINRLSDEFAEVEQRFPELAHYLPMINYPNGYEKETEPTGRPSNVDHRQKKDSKEATQADRGLDTEAKQLIVSTDERTEKVNKDILEAKDLIGEPSEYYEWLKENDYL